MRAVLEAHGIPGPVIVVETRSRSTQENAASLRPILERLPGKKVLLTSDYHMRRAHRTFRRLGLDVIPAPFPDALKQSNGLANRWPVFAELCQETIKAGWYWWKGWTQRPIVGDRIQSNAMVFRQNRLIATYVI